MNCLLAAFVLNVDPGGPVGGALAGFGAAAIGLTRIQENLPTADVLDAAAAAWTARRVARGEHLTVPEDPSPGEPLIIA